MCAWRDDLAPPARSSATAAPERPPSRKPIGGSGFSLAGRSPAAFLSMSLGSAIKAMHLDQDRAIHSLGLDRDFLAGGSSKARWRKAFPRDSGWPRHRCGWHGAWGTPLGTCQNCRLGGIGPAALRRAGGFHHGGGRHRAFDCGRITDHAAGDAFGIDSVRRVHLEGATLVDIAPGFVPLMAVAAVNRLQPDARQAPRQGAASALAAKAGYCAVQPPSTEIVVPVI